MNKDEYDEFVEYLFHEHIENRLAKVRSKIARGKLDDELQNRVEELSRALRAIRLIVGYANDNETIRRSFTPELFNNIMSQVEKGTRFSNDIAVDTGIVDVIEEYYEEIVSGMKVDHFPTEDFSVLRFAGSPNAHQEINFMIQIVKSRKERFLRENDNFRFSRRLINSVDNIQEIRKALPKEPYRQNEPNRNNVVKRAVFKGLGSITQGALLTIVDITLAAGVWTVTLPTETTTVGAVASIATGVGMTLTGIGELRGE